MHLTLKLPAMALGLALGLAALPTAYSDMHGGMTVLMRSSYIADNPDKLKWKRNMATPWGMRTVTLYGDPTKSGPYVFRAKMPSGYKREAGNERANFTRFLGGINLSSRFSTACRPLGIAKRGRV